MLMLIKMLQSHSRKGQRSTAWLLQGKLPYKAYPGLLGVLKSTILMDKICGIRISHSLHHQPPLAVTTLSQLVRIPWPRAFSVHIVRAVTAPYAVKSLGRGHSSSIVLGIDRLSSEGISLRNEWWVLLSLLQSFVVEKDVMCNTRRAELKG